MLIVYGVFGLLFFVNLLRVARPEDAQGAITCAVLSLIWPITLAVVIITGRDL